MAFLSTWIEGLSDKQDQVTRAAYVLIVAQLILGFMLSISGLAYGAQASHDGDLFDQSYKVQLLDLCATAALSVGVALILAQVLGAVVFWKSKKGNSEWLPAYPTFELVLVLGLFVVDGVFPSAVKNIDSPDGSEDEYKKSSDYGFVLAFVIISNLVAIAATVVGSVAAVIIHSDNSIRMEEEEPLAESL